VQALDLPAIVLWPNADAGAEHIAAGIRQWREHNDDSKLHFFKNLPTADYVQLMAKASCIVGNSSSAIREGAFIGTPAVNVGPRQDGRDRGSNVIDVDYDNGQVADAVRTQVGHGRYESEPIYGDGQAGKRIAEILAATELSIHKRITY
jgi:UDP-N-acetylglucosamine 2-epimerase